MIIRISFLLTFVFFLLCTNFLFAEVVENTEIKINYEDLVYLYNTPQPNEEAFNKLNYQLNTPLIEQPKSRDISFTHNDVLGDYFRVVHWNVERGYHVDNIIEFLSNPNIYQYNPSLFNEVSLIAEAKILTLNEVDLGIPRTNYENIAKKIADSIMGGYVFAPEFIEVDPYQLGVKKYSSQEKAYIEDGALKQFDNINKNQYKGLHGNAIITKYPIVSAKIIRLPICYEWYKSESEKLSFIEKAKREAADKVVAEKLLTEIRRGGRNAIIADIELPNKNIVTIVSTHLENRCEPECRQKQVEFILNELRFKKTPVIIAGDFNTTGSDASPTGVKKEFVKRMKDPEYIARTAALYLTPLGWVHNLVGMSFNQLRQFSDPTAINIPVVLPNKEKKLFSIIKEFMFQDGGMFDVRGDVERVAVSRGEFGNSNERKPIGYHHTYEANRAFGIIKYKLDWLFVKPPIYIGANKDVLGYSYAPHFGRTYKYAVEIKQEKLSDHNPISIDIPVQEPNISLLRADKMGLNSYTEEKPLMD